MIPSVLAVSKIAVLAGVTSAGTIDAGISDRWGLSDSVYEAEDVYQVKRSQTDRVIPKVDITNSTVDYSTVGHGDDFAIFHKTSLDAMSQRFFRQGEE